MTKFTNLLTLASSRLDGRGLARRDDGSLAVVQLAVSAFFAVLLVFVFNMNTAVHDKLETQNAADAAARTAATWLARGLNALSATNHLMGEATAMLAVHEGMAGPNPGGGSGDTKWNKQLAMASAELTAAVYAIEPVPPVWFLPMPHVLIPVREKVYAEAAVLKARRILKYELARIYVERAAILKSLSTTSWGEPVTRSMDKLMEHERVLGEENDRVNALLDRAIALKPANTRIRTETLPRLREYADKLFESIPEAARSAAEEVGRLNGVAIRLFPKMPEPDVAGDRGTALPVEKDPLARASDLSPISPDWYGPDLPKKHYPLPAGAKPATNMRRQIVKITQLCRAAFPWVNYHRVRVLRYMERDDGGLFPFTKIWDLYFDESTGATIRVCDELQHRGFELYVLRRPALPDKGYEKWTDDPADADNVFSVIAVAGRFHEPAVGSAFANLLPKQALATAQAIVYNANPQERSHMRINLNRKRIAPWRQPKTGWDTLQWAVRDDWPAAMRSDDDKLSSSYDNGMPYELVGSRAVLEESFEDYPEVRVGWHAKLVGVSASRVADMRRPADGDAELADFLQLTADDFKHLGTH